MSHVLTGLFARIVASNGGFYLSCAIIIQWLFSTIAHNIILSFREHNCNDYNGNTCVFFNSPKDISVNDMTS